MFCCLVLIGVAWVVDSSFPWRNLGVGWAWFWGYCIGMALVTSALWYFLAGWWTNARLRLCGAARDPRAGRRLNVFAALPQAVPVLAYYAALSLSFPQPDQVLLTTTWRWLYGLALLGTVWGTIIKWRGAQTWSGVRPRPAAFWFLALPIAFYVLLLTPRIHPDGLVGQLHHDLATAVDREPTKLQGPHFEVEYPLPWVVKATQEDQELYLEGHAYKAVLESKLGRADAYVLIAYHDTAGANQEFMLGLFFGLSSGAMKRWGGALGHEFERWGPYEGLGREITAELPHGVAHRRIFFTQVSKGIVVIEEYQGAGDGGMSDPGLEMIRNTLRLR